MQHTGHLQIVPTMKQLKDKVKNRLSLENRDEQTVCVKVLDMKDKFKANTVFFSQN